MNNDLIYLLHIHKKISGALRLAAKGKAALIEDEDVQAAVLYHLQTLSESTIRLSQTIRDTQPEIPWQRIKGFRNRVVHDYLSIDFDLVWSIIQNELPVLQIAIESMMCELEENDNGDDSV